MRVADWPVSFKQLARIGHLDSPVAIVTLWTPLQLIERCLRQDQYAILTQLYSKDVGVNALLRGCLSNTAIRYLIVTGNDLSQSGQALVNLKTQGVDEKNSIIGSANAVIDKEIPREAVERFRNNVDVIDLRHVKQFGELPAILSNLPHLPDYGEPQLFPEAKVDIPDRFPSEQSLFPVRAKTVGEAWLQALQAVMKFGSMKESQRGEQQKEAINLAITITDEDPDSISWKEYFNFTREDLERYYPQVLSPDMVDTVKYTYGKRLMDFQGKDQIALMIEELKRAPHTRRAVAVLWDVLQDAASDEPPCFNLLQALVQDGRLFLTAFIRSNDMVDAWPRNAFALRKLQQRIAKETGHGLGHLTTISGSAHIYQRSMKQAMAILDGYPVIENVAFDLPGKLMQDRRGNVTFSVIGSTIKIAHLSVDGKRLEEHTVSSAKEAILWLTWQKKVSDIHHAMYLGQELEKAEMAMKMGLHYVQDKVLDLKAAL
ncbi:thymidylate synthase [Candidatus Woesearchaeota archaeon]|nr:thymidylate synthase [Candidatus Woesearchaeota archaeon]